LAALPERGDRLRPRPARERVRQVDGVVAGVAEVLAVDDVDELALGVRVGAAQLPLADERPEADDRLRERRRVEDRVEVVRRVRVEPVHAGRPLHDRVVRGALLLGDRVAVGTTTKAGEPAHAPSLTRRPYFRRWTP